MYMFGYSGEAVITCTFCSSTPPITLIAAHRLNKGGASMELVLATNASIQLASLRFCWPEWPVEDAESLFGSTFVMAVVIPQPIWICLGVILTFVPTDFTIVWDGEGPAVGKWDRRFYTRGNPRDNLVLTFGGVHKRKCVVVVHDYRHLMFAPKV